MNYSNNQEYKHKVFMEFLAVNFQKMMLEKGLGLNSMKIFLQNAI